jgi:hypothetical protein
MIPARSAGAWISTVTEISRFGRLTYCANPFNPPSLAEHPTTKAVAALIQSRCTNAMEKFKG